MRGVLGVWVPDGAVCEGHASPMDYLEHAFFERGDAVVWANRGGGKTFYGAVATLLDMVFKPGVRVRILGGSLEQSSKMYGYLRWMLERGALGGLVDGKVTQKGVRLVNGSEVEILAQSERAVRGQRVQKLRCDELELFDREVWEAAQFVTRGAVCGGVRVEGAVEAFSTMHRPYGLMREVVGEDAGRSVFRWSALDVMGRCEAERACAGCVIEGACEGRAKEGRGFLSVGDVIRQRKRSSAERFDAEMLCLRPSRSDAVFGRFDPGRHVRGVEVDRGLEWVGGMDFGMRSPLVMLWAQLRERGGERVVEVVDEYVATDRTMSEHAREIEGRGWPGVSWVGVDPAGGARNEQTGLSNIGWLRKRGYRVRAKRSGVMDGVELLRWRLDGVGDGPLLVIDPRCAGLIEAMTCYHFDGDRPWSGEPVKDGYDHAVDALRYMVVNMGVGGRVERRGY